MVFWLAALSAAGNLACALSPTLAALVAARFATGATVGAIIPISMAWIGDAVPYERRQTVLARFLVGHMLGVGLAAAGAGSLAALAGWRAAFVALAAIFAATAALVARELRTNPATRAPRASETTLGAAFAALGQLLRRHRVRVVLATVFLEGALFHGAFAFVAWHAQTALGLGLAASGLLVAAFAAGGLLYAVSAGRIVPFLGERGLVTSGGLLLGVAYAGLALSPSAAVAFACVLALGVGLYMSHNTLQLHATQMAPEARGAALALFAFCLFLGQAAGVWIAAGAVDTAGSAAVFATGGASLAALALAYRRAMVRGGA
ncbi:MAG: MFS transporter [Burkholderiales bacterium]|nr:MFS transporter [Burkholderiales bacterium]